jgi:hypothetical protein
VVAWLLQTRQITLGVIELADPAAVVTSLHHDDHGSMMMLVTAELEAAFVQLVHAALMV